ncbi:hypothetical protein ASG95_14085 [Phycicoccus sp. Soil803]|nr:hypothetical protein ASG95_14085 [Phycicoccus sp. Soil803]KRF27903.1 hypothetical protein ASG91_10435 [Phycicoccus sp. Soil802]
MVVSATAVTAVAVTFAVVLTGAFAGREGKAVPAALTTSPHGHSVAVTAPPEAPLRAGERFVTLRMPTAYTPKAPAGPGTDDYRCFLLDPRLTAKSVVTGINVLPGNPDVVHHVILFRVPAEKVARAEEMDRLQVGQGWTCFGGTGVESQGAGLNSAPWLGAWAPGGGERVLAPDLGMPVEAGSRIIMQVHYNLLAGRTPDQSAAKLRVAADDGKRKTLQTVLLPAPVEVPCRPTHPGPLCDRKAAMADVQQRFGIAAGRTGDALHLLCPGNKAGPTQTCTRPVTQASTIRAVAGHMHLLGTKISVTVNQGKADERTILDIPIWDFDDQGSRPVQPAVKVGPGDTLTVSCTHDQRMRDLLPSFEGIPERYVVWGEGTTDEMCLGIVMVTRP